MLEIPFVHISSVAEDISQKATQSIHQSAVEAENLSAIRTVSEATRRLGREYLGKGLQNFSGPHTTTHRLDYYLNKVDVTDQRIIQLATAFGLISSMVMTLEDAIATGWNNRRYGDHINDFFDSKLISPLKLDDQSRRIGVQRATLSVDIHNIAKQADQTTAFATFLVSPHDQTPLIIREHLFSLTPLEKAGYENGVMIFLEAYDRFIKANPTHPHFTPLTELEWKRIMPTLYSSIFET